VAEPRQIINFTGGELSKRALGDPTSPVYAKGLRTCENFIPFTQGGLQARPGTVDAGAIIDESVRGRMIPFKFGTSAAYSLEFGDYVFRVWKNNSGTYEEVNASAWNIQNAYYESKSFSVNSQETNPRGVFFKSDGTKMYIVGQTGDAVFQYTLSTAWDVSTASYDSKSADVSSETGLPRTPRFSSDGTKMYVMGFTEDAVFQYTLSTAWDVSTATYATKSLDYSAEEADGTGFAFNDDGTKVYVNGYGNTIFQYTLGTAWDISTGSYASKSLTVANRGSIIFKSDGTSVFLVITDTVYRYDLSTAWDISTGTLYGSFGLSSQGTGMQDIFVDSSGARMFTVDGGTKLVYQYGFAPITPYPIADLQDIQFSQSNDVLYLAHSSYPRQKILRSSETEWIITPVTDTPPPTRNIKESPDATLTLSAYTGTGITITAGSATFISSSDVGKVITAGVGKAVITAYTSTTVVTADVVDDFDNASYTSGNWYIQGSPYTQLTPSATGPVNGEVILSAIESAFRSGADSLPTDIGKYVYINGGVVKITNVISNPEMSDTTYSTKSADVSGQDSAPSDVAFSSDGLTMFVVGFTNTSVFQYTLTVAWDVSTATYASKSVDVSGQDSNPRGIAFNLDGTRMYIVGDTNNKIFQYTLTTAWDVSTASYASRSLSVGSEEANPAGIAFKPDGLKMYTVGFSGDAAYQYTLSVAWDVSTATYDSVSFDVSNEDLTPYNIEFNRAGTGMYILGDGGNAVYQYTLSTAWDISTAAYSTSSLSVGAQEATPTGLAFSTDNTKLYVVGTGGDTVFQYTIASTDNKIAVGDIVKELDSTSATFNWTLESTLWNATDGYPSTVVFHQDRLVWGGSTNFPQTISASVVGDYENHARGTGDADSFQITLAAREVNTIEWLVSRQDLIVGTTESEWNITSSGAFLTPTDRGAKLQTGSGSKSLRPVVIDGSVLFYQRLGRKMRELTFNFGVAGYTAPDITKYAEHITDGGIEELSYQQSPMSILWQVRSDGQMVGLSFERPDERSEGIVAWHRHIVGGAFSTGNAVVESVASIPHPTDDYDELWMIVKRTINGATSRRIEVLTKIEDSTSLADYWQLDSGKTTAISASNKITGLDAWEGETLTVVNKTTGAYVGAYTVSSGAITLDTTFTATMLTGYPFTPSMRPVKIVPMYKQTITDVYLDFMNTVGGTVGSATSGNDSIRYQAEEDGDPNDSPPTMITGVKKENVKSKIDRDGSMYIQQTLPYPMTIRSIMPDVEASRG
jgi:6-phosphogluconolactonase (cycloisomerase 2 family)